MNTWAENLIQFYRNLQPPKKLPNGIQWLYPQKEETVMNVVEKFCYKFFNDSNERRLFLGINPGRFGAGITGVNFTASKQLIENCGIDHPWKIQSELSAEFIYAMIEAYGGPTEFYQHHFIGSVCPLGFIEQGKNINYYDDKMLLQTVEPFIIKSIKQQRAFHLKKDKCFAIGGEKNYRYLSSLNERFHFFNQIIPLPHPRFIMQYRRKEKEAFIQLYLEALK